MVIRATAIWLSLLVVAVVAGALRTGLLEPRIGEPCAHVVGTLFVSAVFAAVIWLSLPWIEPRLKRCRLALLGPGWVAATVVFEFVFGHYVMGHPWSRLLADYDLSAGRLWVLVLLVLLCAPLLCGELRRRAGFRLT